MSMKTRRSSIGLQQEEPIEVRNFDTKFSLKPFVRRVEKLSHNQKMAIKRMGFEHLIQMPYQSLSRNLLVELMDRWNCEKRAFLLVPGEIAMTLLDVVVILGLRVTGNPVILRENEPFSELERDYGAAVWNRKIPVASIEKRLDSLGETVNDDFIRSFLLFTFGTILFPNTNGKVDSRYLSLLHDLDRVCHCAWGAAVLENIVDWLGKKSKANVQYVGGCLIFLQIWSYEHIDIGRPSLVDGPMAFPRACRWGSIRSHQRSWFTSKFKELGKNEVFNLERMSALLLGLEKTLSLAVATLHKSLSIKPTAEDNELIVLNIVWKLKLTSEEKAMDTIKELLEAKSDGEELVAQRCNVSIDKADNVRTSLTEMDITREVHWVEEDSSKLAKSPNENEDILYTSNESKVQLGIKEHPWTISESSSPILISDEEDGDNLKAREKNMKLKREIDDLRKENQLLKTQLSSSSTLEKENDYLRKEVENLRRENQLSTSLVARLERLVFAKDVNATEEPSSGSDGNGKGNGQLEITQSKS